MIEVWGVPIMAEVEDIVEDLHLELQASGIPLIRRIRPTFNNIMICCPEHAEGMEKNPSCGVSTKDAYRQYGNGKKELIPAGTVHCFTCGFGGDLATLVSKCFGYNDAGKYGYKWLMKRFVTIQKEERKGFDLPFKTGIITPEREYISEEELDSYRYFHPYMYQRKLTDKIIDYFDIGYDAETKCITFPVCDPEGRVLFVQRRAVKGKFFGNASNVHKTDTVYGLWHVMQNLSWIKEVYICESIIDALTCWTHRVAAVSTMGAQPGINQIKLLRRMPILKKVMAYDNDEAGMFGMRKLEKGLGTMHRLLYPEGVKDINAMTEEQFLNREVTLFES